MRHIVNPQQGRLFNVFQGIIPPLGFKQICGGWQGIFRHVILHLLPAPKLAENFHPTLGRHTKELYSIAGLLFLQEVHDWTDQESVDAYLFHTDVHYALNMETGTDEMCLRTFERHRKLFLEDELASEVMDRVTKELVQQLELNVEQQRLDSTHVFSNMASFGRMRLMGVAIKRFLTQVQRHDLDAYRALPETLRQRYGVSVAKLFASEGKSTEDRNRTRQQVAEQLHDLIDLFANHPGLCQRSTYKALVTVFEQQCQVVEAKVEVRAKTGGDCLQNPSDPDATYDGHKGQGYKAQMVETCSSENDVQMILGVLPQTAVDQDTDAVKPVLEELKEKGWLPETMLADTTYGGDENVQMAAEMGVELVSPVAGRAPEASPTPSPPNESTSASATIEPLTVDDFAVDERNGTVTACPAGRIPLKMAYDSETQTTTIEMPVGTCSSCPDRKACPIQTKPGGRYVLSYTDKQRRLAARRREEDTEAFRERYARRSGIESTNSGLKRRLGLGWLRVRGAKAVFHAVYLKAAGWNLFRAVASGKLAEKVTAAMGWLGSALGFLLLLSLSWIPIRTRSGPQTYTQRSRFSKTENTECGWFLTA